MAAVALEGIFVLLCIWQPAGAQTLQRSPSDPPVAVDRPTQRWLPLPEGDNADLNSRARLLQQLQEVMSAESGGASLPKLSESQLRQMESALEQLREQIGEDKLPNLEDIPPEWINEALADPLIRKQAQQLLEQYSRDRKLPNPPKNSAPTNDTNVPFPRRTPSASNRPSPSEFNGQAKTDLPRRLPNDPQPNDPRPNSQRRPGSELTRPADRSEDEDSNAMRREQSVASESARPENAQPENAQPANAQPANVNGGAEKSPEVRKATPLPKKPDAERVEALKQLFERLKKIEEDEKSYGANAAQSTPSSKSPRGDVGSAPQVKPQIRPQSNSATRTPRSSSPTPRLSNPLGENGMRSRVPNVVPDEQQPLPSNLDEAGSDERIAPKMEEATEGTSSELRPDNPLLQDPIAETVKTQNSAKAPIPNAPATKKGEGLRGDPRLNSTPSAGQPSKAGRQNEAGGIVDAQSRGSGGGSSKPAKEDALDLKTQLERQGLGSTLKSLVEKTLREQGELDSKRKENAARGDQKSAGTSSKESTNQSSGNQVSKQQPAAKSSAQSSDFKKPSDLASSNGSKKSANNPSLNSNSAARPNADSNPPSSMSGLRDLAAQVWGAIRTTPGETSARNESNVGGSDKGDSAAEPGYSWGGAAWVLGLVVVSLLALFLLLAKKRIELATAARTAEAKVAKELLADGIRTRADVVRAFHRFVLRRAQPVATWWNHRYVVSRLTQATPQLGSVITELANVYEQARYLPPEVELSPDDLNRVQSALKQCLAGSA